MKKTPYHRSQRNRALEELTAEVRALRAEVAMLRASHAAQRAPEFVPYPYPQPYPVYPQPCVPYRYPQPVNPWYTPFVTYTSDTSNVTLQGANNLSVGAGWDGSTNVVLSGAVGD